MCANAAVLLLMPLNVLCIFPLKGKRTLGLLVENCGRVNYGKTLDEQRKGTSKFNKQMALQKFQSDESCLEIFSFYSRPLEKLINIVLRSIKKLKQL